jgi:GTP cyclohydrolase I
MNHGKIEKGVTLILQGLGVDLNDHNYTDTPERYARAVIEMFQPPETEWATFHEEFSDFILLRGHKMWSLCPHHLLPVHFEVSLAYVPGGSVLGLSKLARLLHECNDGPLLQERFTKIATDKVAKVCPGVQGAACLIHGVHSCLSMRGVKSVADFVTYRLSGVFQEDKDLERRFFELVRR